MSSKKIAKKYKKKSDEIYINENFVDFFQLQDLTNFFDDIPNESYECKEYLEELYYPKSLNDFLDCPKIPDTYLLIIHGDTGTGKSCLSRLILQDYNVHEILNPETDEQIQEILSVAKNESIFNDKEIAFIFEEIDSTPVEFIAKIIETLGDYRVILVLNRIKKTLKNILNTYENVGVVELSKPTKDIFLKFIQRICSDQQVILKPKVSEMVYNKYNDFRQFFNFMKMVLMMPLQNIEGKQMRLVSEYDFNVITSFSDKDAIFESYSTMCNVFSGHSNLTMRDILKMCSSDSSSLTDVIYSNIDKLPLNINYEILNCLSISDKKHTDDLFSNRDYLFVDQCVLPIRLIEKYPIDITNGLNKSFYSGIHSKINRTKTVFNKSKIRNSFGNSIHDFLYFFDNVIAKDINNKLADSKVSDDSIFQELNSLGFDDEDFLKLNIKHFDLGNVQKFACLSKKAKSRLSRIFKNS